MDTYKEKLAKRNKGKKKDKDFIENNLKNFIELIKNRKQKFLAY